jgi:hypothetical protein
LSNFYHRDSGSKAETTPSPYVGWAQAKATEFGLSFTGTPARIEAVIREGRSVDGDLYLDYDVKGNLHWRPGLDAFKVRAFNDPEVTHVLIPRLDRLARFDDPVDGLTLENDLRRFGNTLVFTKGTLGPLRKNQKPSICESLMGLVEHDHADEERRDLPRRSSSPSSSWRNKGSPPEVGRPTVSAVGS